MVRKLFKIQNYRLLETQSQDYGNYQLLVLFSFLYRYNIILDTFSVEIPWQQTIIFKVFSNPELWGIEGSE